MARINWIITEKTIIVQADGKPYANHVRAVEEIWELMLAREAQLKEQLLNEVEKRVIDVIDDLDKTASMKQMAREQRTALTAIRKGEK